MIGTYTPADGRIAVDDAAWQAIEESRNLELSCEEGHSPYDAANADERLREWRSLAVLEQEYDEAEIRVVDSTIRPYPGMPGRLKFTALVVARHLQGGE